MHSPVFVPRSGGVVGVASFAQTVFGAHAGCVGAGVGAMMV
jgi:hypothetical protein